MVKICIDAGHYGKYNRSPVNPKYYESDMAWNLHLLLKKALESYGVSVVTTRSSQAADKALTARGGAAAGCDLFISLHSNAIGNGPQGWTDRCEVIYPITGNKRDLAESLASTIKSTMCLEKESKVYSKKGTNGDYYGVIRGAASVGVPGLILEHSFHDYSKGGRCPATWLSDPQNLSRLAAAEAKTIAEHFCLEKPSSTNGTFMVRITADKLNVRKGPGTNYGVAAVVEKGEAFTITDTSGTWGKLLSGIGWINCKAPYAQRI